MRRTSRIADCKSSYGYLIGLLLLASMPQVNDRAMAGEVNPSNGSNRPAKSPFLEGSVKDDASLNPHIEIVPPTPKSRSEPGRASQQAGARSAVYPPFRVNASQFGGYGKVQNANLGGGSQNTNLGGGLHNTSPGTGIGAGSHPIAPHIIPPISSYTLTPRANSSTFPGAHPPGLQNGVGDSRHPSPPSLQASFPTRVSVPLPPRRSGVTAYAPGYSVDTVSTGGGGGGITGGGGGPYIHRLPMIHSFGDVNSRLNTQTGGGSLNSNNLSARPLSSQPISFAFTRNGLMSWSPQFEIHHDTKPGVIKHTLGGMYWSGAPGKEELHATAARLPVNPHAGKPDGAGQGSAPTPVSLVAKPMTLPDISQIQNKKLTWEEWYKRVARAIYDRWDVADVGPGMVTIRVSVDNFKNLSGEVVEFFPALGVNRNVESETAFRQAAVNAVNLIERFEIPPLPWMPQDPAALNAKAQVLSDRRKALSAQERALAAKERMLQEQMRSLRHGALSRTFRMSLQQDLQRLQSRRATLQQARVQLKQDRKKLEQDRRQNAERDRLLSERDRMLAGKNRRSAKGRPAKKNPVQTVVTFDVEMKRTIDGHAGFSVAASPGARQEQNGSANLTAAQK